MSDFLITHYVVILVCLGQVFLFCLTLKKSVLSHFCLPRTVSCSACLSHDGKTASRECVQTSLGSPSLWCLYSLIPWFPHFAFKSQTFLQMTWRVGKSICVSFYKCFKNFTTMWSVVLALSMKAGRNTTCWTNVISKIMGVDVIIWTPSANEW